MPRDITCMPWACGHALMSDPDLILQILPLIISDFNAAHMFTDWLITQHDYHPRISDHICGLVQTLWVDFKGFIQYYHIDGFVQDCG